MDERLIKAYFEKIAELEQNRDKSNLTEADLRAIAREMGLAESEIDQYIADNTLRGDTFAQLQNWLEAAKAYTQVLVVAPQQVAILVKAAEVNAAMYYQNREEEAKKQAFEYAQRALQLEPGNTRAAQVITRLQNDRPFQKNMGPGQTTTAAQKNGARVLLVLVVLVFFAGYGLFSSLSVPGDKPSKSVALLTQEASVFVLAKVATGTRGSVFWIISETDEVGNGKSIKVLQLDIYEASTRKKRKTLRLATSEDPFYSYWRNPTWFKQAGEKWMVFLPDASNFQARDIYSGEVVENKDILRDRFEVLRAGLGEIKSTRFPWLELTTREGRQFMYQPAEGLLLEGDLQAQIFKRRDKPTETEKTWYLHKEGEKLQHVAYGETPSTMRIMMPKMSNTPYQYRWVEEMSALPAEIKSRIKSPWEKTVSEASFEAEIPRLFSPQVLLANDEYLVLWGKTEIGAEAQSKLLVLSKSTQKLRWQKNQEQMQASLLLSAITGENSLAYHDWTIDCQGDKLLIFVHNLKKKKN
ncbi:MAG: hypothetical protein HC913_02705 [Microscillaceae bacterium]|nr:hypothetical protein [Microscillaceae bacterium]